MPISEAGDMVATLVRVSSSDEGTFGVLTLGGQATCLTLEPPDRGNEPNRSSIPAGRYRCRKRISPRFGTTYEVVGVPGRSAILFHAGNRVKDTKGCILLGRRFDPKASGNRVLDSRAAMGLFLGALDGTPGFELIIHNHV